jgi:microcystin-dependent protein
MASFLKTTIIQELVSTVKQWPSTVLPTGWLWCNGAAISRTTYSALYNAITLGKGNFTVTLGASAVVTLSTHGLITGDCVELTTTGALYTGLSVNTNYYVIYIDTNTFYLATSYANSLASTKITTSGTQSGVHSLSYCPYGISTSANFLLPDFRGVFPRGAGTNGVLTNANSVAFMGGLGAYQNDREQGHYHAVRQGTTYYGISTDRFTPSGSSPLVSLVSGASQTDVMAREIVTDGTNGTPRTGAETNPANLGINYVIKY